MVEALIAPLDYDLFFEEFVGQRVAVAKAEGATARTSLLGPDPGATLLGAFASHAHKIVYHSGNPGGPPPPVERAANRDEFEATVAAFHQRGYAVRVPDVTALTAELALCIRALERVLRTKVDTYAFWSAAGGTAPVHFDLHDIVSIQLKGTKRWFVSSEPPMLVNNWHPLAQGKPELGPHMVIDQEPGDVLYMPRGTLHTVQSEGESIHLSIGFIPMTVRDAVIAVIDRLADLDIELRKGVARRADSAHSNDFSEEVSDQVHRALAKISAAAHSQSLVDESIDHRFARAIADLPKLPKPTAAVPISLTTRLRRTALAMSQLVHSPHVIDFTMPGDHILVHPGAEAALRTIADRDEFAVGDLGDNLGADVKIALASRFVAAGFLEPALPGQG